MAGKIVCSFLLTKFILEGICTALVGAVSFWIIVDFPDDANFLNPLEKYVALSRLKTDGQASWRAEEFRWEMVKATFVDWKTYTSMLLITGTTGPQYAFALFVPSIIKELGFSSIKAQLLSVPPYVLSTMVV
jgi:hypothetical protein